MLKNQDYNTCSDEHSALTEGLRYLVYNVVLDGQTLVMRTPKGVAHIIEEDMEGLLSPGDTMTITAGFMFAEQIEALEEFAGW